MESPAVRTATERNRKISTQKRERYLITGNIFFARYRQRAFPLFVSSSSEKRKKVREKGGVVVLILCLVVYTEKAWNLVYFRGQIKLEPRPDWSPLGVFKFFDGHPRPFHMGSPGKKCPFPPCLPPRAAIFSLSLLYFASDARRKKQQQQQKNKPQVGRAHRKGVVRQLHFRPAEPLTSLWSQYWRKQSIS